MELKPPVLEYKGLILDQFQVDAIEAIDSNHSVVVSAPTGSGKTLIADYIIDRDIKDNKRVVYTAPIKALSNQKFKDFCRDYGEDKIGLLTGDTVINPGAQVLIMTTEIYHNMVLVKDEIVNNISYVIFDEIHYINDPERGYVWEESIIFSPGTVRFLCLSATIPNAREFADWIEAIKSHTVVVVRHHERPVPLHKLFYDVDLGITTLDKIEERKELDRLPSYEYVTGKSRFRSPKIPPPDHCDLIRRLYQQAQLPCIYFTFSRAACQKYAVELERKVDFLEPHEKSTVSVIVQKKFSGIAKEVNALHTTQLLRRLVGKGIAFHHAGILPVLKELVEELFSHGLIKVLYATETFAVGINMPAKVVCFDSLRKFDGREFRYLNSKEYFQIAGRAGRRGIDTEGKAIAAIHRPTAEIKKIKGFTDQDVDPIISQFKLSYNTVLNLIKLHTDEEIDIVLASSFYCFQTFGKSFKKKENIFQIKRQFKNIVKVLEKNGYVRDKALTPKGEFASRIFCDEMLISELFATEFYYRLDEEQIIMLLGAIVYEPRVADKFFNKAVTKGTRQLMTMLSHHPFLKNYKQFRKMAELSSVLHPCYTGKRFVELLPNATLLEGDLIKFFKQIQDRIGQIRKATQDQRLIGMLRECADCIDRCLEGIDAV
ncbi:DEAD/DEAH box helicase [Candidatus Woesearchaeota archaeon]|nr:DEAD/DEAH box helicase [Candidatus Woesearchaeota archaeon]